MEFNRAEVNNKKKRKLSFKLLGIVFIILILYIIYWMHFKETPFLISESPNKINEVEINEYENSL